MVCLLAATYSGCKDDQGPTQGEGQISGKITDASTGLPLAQVSIEVRTLFSGLRTLSTDVNGDYNLKLDLDSAVSVSLTLTKSGYRDTTISVKVSPGVLQPLSVTMTPRSVIVGGTGGGTGVAQTIAFLGSNPTQITVYGVGGQETSILGYEVRDSLGLPIDAAHAVTVVFSALGGPNGGEYISPPTATTNSLGRVFTTFNSGIRSGVVQIVATVTVGTRVITSSPVRLIINAGFPVQSHFSIAPVRHNFPALGTLGRRNPVGVLVGDVYSNPVAENTAVYFRSSAGVVQASVFTNRDGQGGVDLISGNPGPFGGNAAAAFGDGYHYVVARTIGQGGTPVQDSVLILWSGASMISNLTPLTFSIPNGGFQDFTFTASDYLGHPLSAGTRIAVGATVPPPPDPLSPVNQVQLSFGVDGAIVLEDVIFPGPGTTDFSFRLSDGTFAGDTVATAVTVTVSISSPNANGGAHATISGIVR